MPISKEPRIFGNVTELVSNPDGWKRDHLKYKIDRSVYIGGNPHVRKNHQPEELITPLQEAWQFTKDHRPTDFNGSKVAVQRLSLTDGILDISGVTTDYFTLRGLPEAAKKTFQEYQDEIVINKSNKPDDAIFETTRPAGICTHNVAVTSNGEIIMMVRSQRQGFHEGKVSVSEEEQTELTDNSPFATSSRSYKEELNIKVSQKNISMLGVGVEKNTAYMALAYIADSGHTAKKLAEKWYSAQDHDENTAIFAVPTETIDQWLNKEKIGSSIWHSSLLAGKIHPDASLILHDTSPWRINLVKEFLLNN